MTTMTQIESTHLAIKWSVSRGRDTYGYSICTMTDVNTGKKYRCNGGGYDMVGTSLAQWLQDAYQDRLWAIRERAFYIRSAGNNIREESGLYGMTWTEDEVYLDGGCGAESIIRVANAIGITVIRTYDKKGHTTGYLIAAGL